MSRILFAWELGGGTGHLHHLAAIAQVLERRDHELLFAVRDLATASRFQGLAGSTLLQAPVLMREAKLPPSLNYAELLNRVGYLDVKILGGLIGAWRQLIRLVDPDLVLVDHSPTALIGARLEDVPRASIGTGFMMPPRISPMPTMQPWRSVDPARLARAEADVLARINAAVTGQGGRAYSALFEILDVQGRFLTTFPEFDHYGPRAEEEYLGGIDVSASGKPVEWPVGEGPRLFGYYHAGYPHFVDMLDQFAQLPWPAVVVAPGASRAQIARFSKGRLRLTTEQYDLRSVAASAALAVCHAGHGTMVGLVRGGCPIVTLPVMIEQAQCAFRVSQSGVGLSVKIENGKPDVVGAIRRMLDDGAYGVRAKSLAQRYAAIDPVVQAERIARMCEEIIT